MSTDSSPLSPWISVFEFWSLLLHICLLRKPDQKLHNVISSERKWTLSKDKDIILILIWKAFWFVKLHIRIKAQSCQCTPPFKEQQQTLQYIFLNGFQTSVIARILSLFGCVWLFVVPWTSARQAPLSVGSSRQEYWSGLPCPSPGGLPHPGIKPMSPASPALQADSLPAEPSVKPPLLSLFQI